MQDARAVGVLKAAVGRTREQRGRSHSAATEAVPMLGFLGRRRQFINRWVHSRLCISAVRFRVVRPVWHTHDEVVFIYYLVEGVQICVTLPMKSLS